MTERKIPFGWTLSTITAICAVFWWATILFPLWVGAIAAILGTVAGALLLVIETRKAFTFGSQYAADYIAGKTAKRPQPAENPLMLDPFYAGIQRKIDYAILKHKPVKHLYVERELRVRELLGTKGVV